MIWEPNWLYIYTPSEWCCGCPPVCVPHTRYGDVKIAKRTSLSVNQYDRGDDRCVVSSRITYTVRVCTPTTSCRRGRTRPDGGKKKKNMNKIKIISTYCVRVYVYRGCSHVTSAADENDLRVFKTSAVMQRRACRPLIRLRANRVRYNITIFMLRDYRSFALGYNTLSHRLSIVCPRVDLFFVFYMVFFFFCIAIPSDRCASNRRTL